MKILVVGDDREAIEATGDFFETKGHEVLRAGDGMLALLIVRENKDFDVVISDFTMPRIDGLTLLKNIKGRSASVRLFLVTGNVGEFERLKKEASNAGVEKVLLKGSAEVMEEFEKL